MKKSLAKLIALTMSVSIVSATTGTYIAQAAPVSVLTEGYYRVRKSWGESSSQIGSFRTFSYAKALADSYPGYEVYGPDGTQVYPEITVSAPKTTTTTAPAATPAPAPAATTAPATATAAQTAPVAGSTVTTSKSVSGYMTAQDAASGTNARVTLSAGTYYVYKVYNGIVNLSRVKGVPGSWVNPKDYSGSSQVTSASSQTASTSTTAAATSAQTTAAQTVTKVTTDYLYMRSSASTSAGVITLLPVGAKVTVLKSQNGWDQVRYGSLTGWSYAAYLKVVPTTVTTYQTNTAATTVTASATAQKIIAAARSVVGMPYVYGGASTSAGGFDCSGLTQWAYKQAGISIPRTVTQQYYGMKKVSDLQPGDIIVYGAYGEMEHAAIYIGNNQIIHSPDVGKTVEIRSMYFYTLTAMAYLRY